MADDAGHSGAGGDAGHQNQAGGNDDAGQSTGGNDDAGRNDSGGRTFTQDEVEHIVQQRLKKYGDYDALKARATELENANKSELQRAQDKAAEAERRSSELEQRLQERLVDASIRDAATERNINPRLAVRLVDTSALEFDDDGEPTSSSLKRVLDAAVKEFPELSGGTRGGADGGARRSSGRVDMNELLRSGRRG